MLSTVKEKEDAHQDPEIQPMKEDDGTFGEYRWEMTSSGLQSEGLMRGYSNVTADDDVIPLFNQMCFILAWLFEHRIYYQAAEKFSHQTPFQNAA